MVYNMCSHHACGGKRVAGQGGGCGESARGYRYRYTTSQGTSGQAHATGEPGVVAAAEIVPTAATELEGCTDAFMKACGAGGARRPRRRIRCRTHGRMRESEKRERRFRVYGEAPGIPPWPPCNDQRASARGPGHVIHYNAPSLSFGCPRQPDVSAQRPDGPPLRRADGYEDGHLGGLAVSGRTRCPETP